MALVAQDVRHGSHIQGAEAKPQRPLRVMMLGLRGFPGVQGGVETHAEYLCPLLVEYGCEMDVIVRQPYQHASAGKTWRGVKFSPLWAPRARQLEAITHTFFGVLYAAVKRPDILHIHAIGPALMAPLARLLGLRVVVTHHGPDYDRQKWGRLAKFALHMGELCGMYWANGRIVISRVIGKLVQDKYQLDSWLIPNGVNLPILPDSHEALDHFGLSAGRYILMVGRLVPEKRHHDLISAFVKSRLAGWKLVLVGASDHPDAYARSVLDAARVYPDIVCTGFQNGLALQELYAHAGIFVLPSSHEGLPIAMLEALSYGLPVIASDIQANKEIACDDVRYYRMGDIDALVAAIRDQVGQVWDEPRRAKARQFVLDRYQWRDIALQTRLVYEDVSQPAWLLSPFISK